MGDSRVALGSTRLSPTYLNMCLLDGTLSVCLAKQQTSSSKGSMVEMVRILDAACNGTARPVAKQSRCERKAPSALCPCPINRGWNLACLSSDVPGLQCPCPTNGSQTPPEHRNMEAAFALPGHRCDSQRALDPAHRRPLCNPPSRHTFQQRPMSSERTN